MDDYKEVFKRELERLNYLYAKANTKSKKVRLAFDLIFFENMYRKITGENVEFIWDNDEVIIDERVKAADGMINSVLKDQKFLLKMVGNAYSVFVDEGFNTYTDYGKQYHKMSEELMQEYMTSFYRGIDASLLESFVSKFDNSELFIIDNMHGYAGLTYPIDSVNKNIIAFEAGQYMSVDEMRILAHEMGHNFEFDNSRKNGIDTTWSKITKTVLVEVSSSFFEYAMINYLIDNKIYLDDALMLKRRFFNQVLSYLIYVLVIEKIGKLNIDYDFMVEISSEEVCEYANGLLKKMNIGDTLFQVGDRIDFRNSFIYGIGKLMGIYVYEMYKKDEVNFLFRFKQALIEYKNMGIKAFENLGLDEETIVSAKILRRVIKRY